MRIEWSCTAGRKSLPLVLTSCACARYTASYRSCKRRRMVKISTWDVNSASDRDAVTSREFKPRNGNVLPFRSPSFHYGLLMQYYYSSHVDRRGSGFRKPTFGGGSTLCVSRCKDDPAHSYGLTWSKGWLEGEENCDRLKPGSLPLTSH
nr:hypothetical protein CFP56_71724 [Quercus suber]